MPKAGATSAAQLPDSPVGDQLGSSTDLEEIDDTLGIAVEDEAARTVSDRIPFVASKFGKMCRQRARHAEQHPRVLVVESGFGGREHDFEPPSGIDVQIEQQRLAVFR